MSQGVLPPRPSLKSAGLFRPAVEPSMPFDFQQLANFRLARGSHKQPNKGGNICVNEPFGLPSVWLRVRLPPKGPISASRSMPLK